MFPILQIFVNQKYENSKLSYFLKVVLHYYFQLLVTGAATLKGQL